MIVQPIVEGQGDVDAVPVLLRRLVEQAGSWDVRIARPHRRKRQQLVQRDTLQSAIKVARLTPECGAVLIILDADDDCPKELAPRLTEWARRAARPIPCAVVMANREYEAWLLAGVSTLRGAAGFRDDAVPHPNPESPRDAKSELDRRMQRGFSYLPTADQARLTAQFDLASAHRSCRSFRKLVVAFGTLLAAAGVHLKVWPPMDWES